MGGKEKMKSNLTTLCYIEKDGKYLMLHRIKKKKDINKDKWIGVGGHFEENESPEECLLREVKEETGFNLEFELCSIQENFLEKDNKKIMQYCFCYKSIYNKDINQESFICKDNKGQIFYWVNINDLQNYKLLPNSTYKLIKDSENIRHIIER